MFARFTTVTNDQYVPESGESKQLEDVSPILIVFI